MSDKVNKVLVGIPSYDGSDALFEESLPGAIRTDEAEVLMYRINGTVTPNARNGLVRNAIYNQCTHILFLDVDMVHPVGTLEKLLKHDKDIIGGYYHSTTKEFPIRVFAKNGPGKMDYFHFIPAKSEVLEVEGIGTGCLMIKLSVFEKLEFPWFDYEWDVKLKMMISEDIYFCRRAQKAGIKMWCDPSIRCGHIGKFVVYPFDDSPNAKLLPCR